MSLKTIRIAEKQDPKLYDGSVLIDEAWAQWSPDREIVIMHLRAIVNHAQQLKLVRGHLFLNELYDQLALPRTYSGQISGWYNTDVNVWIEEAEGPKFWVTFKVEADIHENLD